MCGPSKEDARRAVGVVPSSPVLYDHLGNPKADLRPSVADEAAEPRRQVSRYEDSPLRQKSSFRPSSPCPHRQLQVNSRPHSEREIAVGSAEKVGRIWSDFQWSKACGNMTGFFEDSAQTNASEAMAARRWVTFVSIMSCIAIFTVGASIWQVMKTRQPPDHVMMTSSSRQGPHATLFDCSGPSMGWPLERRQWCCVHRSVACNLHPATTPLPFDCQAGYYKWSELWSPGKKAWCCDHFSLGCQPSTTPVPFECGEGVARWKTEWSADKKAWCCEREAVGCPTSSGESRSSPGPIVGQ